MPRYFVFLRAINVGRHNLIRMDELRDLCMGVGFEGVSTYIQSGNIVLHSNDAEDVVARRLEATLEEHGLRNAAAIVRIGAELSELLDAWSAMDAPGSRKPFVTLFRSPVPPESVMALTHPGLAQLAVREREALSVMKPGYEGPLDVGFLEKKLKIPGTTRYLAVVKDFAEFGRSGPIGPR